MYDHDDEFHHCPQCQRRTRHRVSRGERKLADALWCQTCYHVHMRAQTEAARPRPPHRQAERAA
ncbi:hypothetical protein [Magnetospirillum moscoviense]|uniref:Uncharacterized protein n=1 Tax=Magnetospirillum moscoviense TaxID=1437059 RepID=A0A178MT12_9PROT|nr:hypothetical protein [Magnetospirillum moscoviense]MBF0326521.1 hypothetical protein [Alphaproteobacteria bacterium]OAN51475.1 hypothetical protein A6A05_01030 [Magnetospirillum moscoviense]